MWPPNSGYHLVSSQSICDAWLKMLIFLRKYLLNMATICYKSLLKFAIEFLHVQGTELEVGRGCGHQTLVIILSHHNQSVHG